MKLSSLSERLSLQIKTGTCGMEEMLKLPLLLFMQFLFFNEVQKDALFCQHEFIRRAAWRCKKENNFHYQYNKSITKDYRMTFFCPWDIPSTSKEVSHLPATHFSFYELGNAQKLAENDRQRAVCDRHSHVWKWDLKCETFFSVLLASLEIITTCSPEVSHQEVKNFKSLFTDPLSWSGLFLSSAWMKKWIFKNT